MFSIINFVSSKSIRPDANGISMTLKTFLLCQMFRRKKVKFLASGLGWGGKKIVDQSRKKCSSLSFCLSYRKSRQQKTPGVYFELILTKGQKCLASGARCQGRV